MSSIGFHEDAADLSDATKDMHRAIVSLMEWIRRNDATFIWLYARVSVY